MAKIISRGTAAARPAKRPIAPPPPPRPKTSPMAAQARATTPVPVPYQNLPVWNHSEHGRWKPFSGPPRDETEFLYWDRMTALVARKWPGIVPGSPVPRMAFARMKPADDLDGWCSVDILVLEKPPGADWAGFLSAIAADNLFSVSDHGRYAYISPFFEWGLADYWENGYYDR